MRWNLLLRLFALQAIFLLQILAYQALLPALLRLYHWQEWNFHLMRTPLLLAPLAAGLWGWFWRKRNLQENPWPKYLVWTLAALNLKFAIASLGFLPDVFYFSLPLLGLVWLVALIGLEIQALALLPLLQPRHQFTFANALFVGFGISLLWSRNYLAANLAQYDSAALWTTLALLSVLAAGFWGRGRLPERCMENPTPPMLPAIEGEEAKPQALQIPSLLSVLAWGMLGSMLLLLPFSGLFRPNPWAFLQGQNLWLFLGYWLLVLPLTFFGNAFKRPMFALGLIFYAAASLVAWQPSNALLVLIMAYVCVLPYPWVVALGDGPLSRNYPAAAWYTAGQAMGATALLALAWAAQNASTWAS